MRADAPCAHALASAWTGRGAVTRQRHPGRQRHLRQHPDLAFMQMAPQRLNRRVDQAIGGAGECSKIAQRCRAASQASAPPLKRIRKRQRPLLADPVEQPFEAALDLGQLRQIDIKR